MFTGTILNALGILSGGALGLILGRQLSPPTQIALRSLLGFVTVYAGLHLAWASVNGSLYQGFKQMVTLVLALMVGRVLGRLLRLQAGLNRLGESTSRRFARATPTDPHRFSEGFWICSVLFCAGPLGPLGAVAEGLGGYWPPLALKAVMDGLAVMGLTRMFGWGAMLSAVPVAALQSTLTLVAVRLHPLLDSHGLVDATNAVLGMLIFCVALILLVIKKVRLGDYLPAIVIAPLITWIW